jgi:hypothetical protein
VPALLARGLKVALVTVLVLVAAPLALGDVLVPADPAPPRAPGAVQCIAGAGDVVVYERDGANRLTHPAPPTSAELGASPGQRFRLADQGRFSDCPTVAAATDGTAVAGFLVVAGEHASPRVVVRPPGGSFSPPLGVATPDAAARTPAVDAAPGGWVAVAWVQEGDPTEVVAAVVAPDGTLRRAVVDSDPSGDRHDFDYSPPRVGVDASGAATVAWTRWTVVGERASHEHVRVARSAPGASAWEPVRELGVGGEAPDEPVADEHIGLAVTPGDRVLVAWSDALDVSAVEGDETGLQPATTLASGAGLGLPAVAMTDNGAAVVAFSAFAPSNSVQTQIFAIHRAAGGPWSAARRLSGKPSARGTQAPEGEPVPVDEPPNSVPLATTLTPDGRALVAWLVSHPASFDHRFVAATGQAGGAWARVRTLSAPTRTTVGLPSAWIGPAGDPQIAWIEESQGPRARLRADRLVDDAAAPPPDVAAPRLIVALPAKLRVSARGRIETLRLTVRCSEPCDVQGDIAIAQRGIDPEVIVRHAVAPGRPAVLTFRQPGVSAQITDLRPRHLRVRVTASDRAGNVTVRSRLVAVVRR